MLQRARLLSLAVLGLVASSSTALACQPSSELCPVGPEWPVVGDIPKSKDISGIACGKTDGQTRRCLIVIDDGVSAALVTIKGKTINTERILKLIAKVDGEDLDAEGVAFDSKENAYYVVGSHGKNRGCCLDNASSFSLIRVPINPATGEVALDKGINAAPGAWVAPRNIRPAMERSPQLGKRVDVCLGTEPPRKKKDCKEFTPAQGANIEGIAVFGDTVFLGFRGPVDGDTAYLLAFDRTSLSKDKLSSEATIPIKLGTGKGVRDLAAVADGLLVLSGPEDDDAGQAAIHHFDPKTQVVTLLGRLGGLPSDAKPEGLLVLSPDAPEYEVLVLSDGVRNGGPLEYKVPKKK